MRKTFDDPFEVWQRWFAWRPVWVGFTRVWWEHVERRKKMWGYDPIWEYRLPQEGERGSPGHGGG